MRYAHAFIFVACLATGLALAPLARTQDDGIRPYYWPNRTVGIPVANADQLLRAQNRPSEVQLYYSLNRGPLQKGPKLPLSGMKALDSNQSGFLFTSDCDGDFEFTVQFIFPDGTVKPSSDALKLQQRIVIDTTPPQIRLSATNTGVDWMITDDNLDPQTIKLKYRWPGTREWTPVNRRDFRSVDRFPFQVGPGKSLEVYVEAEDRAGNKSLSQVVRVPGDGAAGAGFTRPGTAGPATTMGVSTPGMPTPRIEYVNTLKFDVDYTIQKMGRSGIQAAHLFVMRNQSGWELVKRFPVKLMPTDKDQTLSLPYEAKEEGSYGFYVIPESGAGKRAEDPRKDDPPLVWVVVDTTPPYVKITGVQVKPGGTRGPLVEITWEVADPNLMPQPVSLEWSPDKTATKWNEIKYRLDNLPGSNIGRFTWEVPDENLWKFWIRARAVDKASNTGESIWPQEVIVDLEQPSAGIVKVRGGNSPIPTSGGNNPIPGSGGNSPFPGSGGQPKTPNGYEAPKIPSGFDTPKSNGSDTPPVVPVIPASPDKLP